MGTGFTTQNSYWRAYTLAELRHHRRFRRLHRGDRSRAGDCRCRAGWTQPITVNLYTSNQPFPSGFPGSLTLIGTSATTVADASLALVNFLVAGNAPAGSQLVVEIFTPNGSGAGNSFFIGSNADPETNPSYLSAADCGVTTPTTTASIGFPDMHIVMHVFGTEATTLSADPTALLVDPQLGTGILNNRVLEMNETPVVVEPQWTNTNVAAVTMTGAASDFTGPGDGTGITYTIDDATADYGLITAGDLAFCTDCYGITITGDRTTEPVHMDATMDEDVTPVAPTFGQPHLILKTWTLHVGESFTDVSNDPAPIPSTRRSRPCLHNGVTAGCGDGTMYCPTQDVLRQEMAVFLLKSFLTSSYVPPACTPPGQFIDVPCPGLYTDWIEDLKTRNITAGCGDGTTYCPDANILRQEMAVFLLKTLLGGDYVPPACTPPGMFTDVACPGLYTDFIEDLKTRGITAGCGDGTTFCPTDPVTRQEMAAFLTITFSLVLYGP